MSKITSLSQINLKIGDLVQDSNDKIYKIISLKLGFCGWIVSLIEDSPNKDERFVKLTELKLWKHIS